MIDNYSIITLCGSTRFKNAFINNLGYLTPKSYKWKCTEYGHISDITEDNIINF